MKKITILADTNDGDYVEATNPINDKQIQEILPLIKQIKEFKPYRTEKKGISWTHGHNYPTEDCVREDLGEMKAFDYYTSKGISGEVIELFEEFIPYSEYGIHTIVSIKIFEVLNERQLL